MNEEEYLDRIILALREKYRQKRAEYEPLGGDILIGTSKVALYKEELFNGKISMMLPDIMKDMNYLDSIVKYRRQNRPLIIKTDDRGDASITFNMIPESDTGSSIIMLERIYNDMKKIWKQNVFYDRGEVLADTLSVAWMDFRAFCLDGSLYCLIFIFYMENQLVVGNFHCGFIQYDVWKPVILKLLTTIRISEREKKGNNERISDKNRAV